MTDFYLQLNEDDALDISSGYVPNAVKAQCRALLDWAEEDERRASRPVKKPRGKKTTSEERHDG